MERTRSLRRTDAASVDIDTSPITLDLPRGSTIFALRGEAWITQHGRLEDIILAAGDRLHVTSGGPVVASATRDRALLHVASPMGVCRGAALDLYDFARCRAKELRRAELSRLGDVLGAALRRWGRRAGAVLPAGARLTPR